MLREAEHSASNRINRLRQIRCKCDFLRTWKGDCFPSEMKLCSDHRQSAEKLCACVICARSGQLPSKMLQCTQAGSPPLFRTDPRSETLKDLYRLNIFVVKNLSIKTALKWKRNLIRPSYKLHIYPMKSKNGYPDLVRLSL
jgi:hypothetical protein